MARSTVVLPLPDGPVNASSSPLPQVSETSNGMGNVWVRDTRNDVLLSVAMTVHSRDAYDS